VLRHGEQTNENEETAAHRSNETEISHGRVLLQGCSRSFYQGPLVSSIG
jgi:hypothetical protein